MDARDEFAATLCEALERLGIDAQPAQLATLVEHYELLVEANRRFNLTGITQAGEAAGWLYADSVAPLAWARQERRRIGRALDIGSGAGFPALPLAVLAAEWQVTALEATGKKARFIEESARRLGLENLRPVHAHSDHWKTGDRFDLVTLKAVADLDRCLTIGQRFTSPGGCIAVYKTESMAADEARRGRAAAKRLGLRALPAFGYELSTSKGPARMALHLFVARGSR